MDPLPGKKGGVEGRAGPMGGRCASEYVLGGRLPLTNEERECRGGDVIFMMGITGRGEQAQHSQ